MSHDDPSEFDYEAVDAELAAATRPGVPGGIRKRWLANCKDCPATVELDWAGDLTTAKEKLRAEGWSTRDGEWLCGTCSTEATLTALRTKDVAAIARTASGALSDALEGLGLPETRELCETWGISPDAARWDDLPDLPLNRARASLYLAVERAVAEVTDPGELATTGEEAGS